LKSSMSRPYANAVTVADQMEKEAVHRAFYRLLFPRLLEMRLEPPMPKRLAMPVSIMKGGMHMAAAAT